jgi:hypothetical protein
MIAVRSGLLSQPATTVEEMRIVLEKVIAVEIEDLDPCDALNALVVDAVLAWCAIRTMAWCRRPVSAGSPAS